MESPLESDDPIREQVDDPHPAEWLKVGVIAAASALAGGMAAAWYYRKTLTRLRQAEAASSDTEFRMPEDDLGEDG